VSELETTPPVPPLRLLLQTLHGPEFEETVLRRRVWDDQVGLLLLVLLVLLPGLGGRGQAILLVGQLVWLPAYLK
jgi:hypothetical protein